MCQTLSQTHSQPESGAIPTYLRSLWLQVLSISLLAQMKDSRGQGKSLAEENGERED